MSRRALLAALCGVLAAPAPAAALDVRELRVKLATQARHLGNASGIYVRDLDTGRTLYARRSDTPRIPASNEKLLVTATALLKYGPAARLRTTLVAVGAPSGPAITGDVALVGAGDPYLTTARLQVLARQLAKLGVERIDGRVLGDGTLFDERRGSHDSRWLYDNDLGGSLGGLVADYGRGSDPALYAAQRLREALVDARVKVRGEAAAGSLGPDTVPLAGVASVPMRTLTLRINVPSDNFAAEMLLKRLGATFGDEGTTPAGAAVVREAMGGLGVATRPFDGSGLSRSDRVSPRELVDLLTEMATATPVGAAFDASLPVAGRAGTLADRMERSTAEDRCRAKTGTLDGVSALSGYCTTLGGQLVAFSVLGNRVDEYAAKDVEDEIVKAIARYTGE